MPDLISSETLSSPIIQNQRFIETVTITNVPLQAGLTTRCFFVNVPMNNGAQFGEITRDGWVDLPFAEVASWPEFGPFYVKLRNWLYAARRAQDNPTP